MFLFITPMLLFSGTFFPLSILPEAAQSFAITVLPLVHLVSITRAITMNSIGLFQLYNLIWIVAISLVLFVVSINLMKKKLII
jgi:lipooligosaccharide transport system permease protein